MTRLRGPTTWVGFCPVDNKVQDAPRRSGLTNVGQSCFINAALQGLYSSRLWRHMLTEVGNEVARDLWHVWRGMMAAAVTRPEPILERWYHGVQEDSFQFLRGGCRLDSFNARARAVLPSLRRLQPRPAAQRQTP